MLLQLLLCKSSKHKSWYGGRGDKKIQFKGGGELRKGGKKTHQVFFQLFYMKDKFTITIGQPDQSKF